MREIILSRGTFPQLFIFTKTSTPSEEGFMTAHFVPLISPQSREIIITWPNSLVKTDNGTDMEFFLNIFVVKPVINDGVIDSCGHQNVSKENKLAPTTLNMPAQTCRREIQYLLKAKV
jgi:hypothetical protein